MTHPISSLLRPGDDGPAAPAAVVISAGKFGWQAAAAFDLAAQNRSALSRPHLLLAGPGGWHEQPDPALAEGAYPPAADWWQRHAPAGRRLAQQVLLRAAEGLAAPELTVTRPLNVYLVASLHEPFCREVLFRILSLLPEVAPHNADLVFTLILAIDSTTFPFLAPAERAELNEAVTRLAGWLKQSAADELYSGRIGWCYLIDTVDLHAANPQPVSGVISGSLPRDHLPDELQAHQAAELLAALNVGLQQQPDYCVTELGQMHRDIRSDQPVARISTAAAGSITLPSQALTRLARLQLALALLETELAGPESPSDYPAAEKRRDHWVDECGIKAPAIRRELSSQAGGQPIPFETPAPRTDLLEDERLLDALASWEQLLWQRWNRPDAPAAVMLANAGRLAQPSAAWLARESEALLGRTPGGTRKMGAFLKLARELLEQQQAEPHYTRTHADHWLRAMFRPLRRAADPTALPDLFADQRRLERALAGRLNRRAVWLRSALMAVALFAFCWLALQVIALALRAGTGVSPLWRGIALDSLPAFGLTLAVCILLAFIPNGLYLLFSENHINRATQRLIRSVQRKYTALREIALRSAVKELYRLWNEQLAAAQNGVDAQARLLQAAQAELRTRLAAAGDLSLLTEDELIPENRRGELLPALTGLPELAQQYLAQHGPLPQTPESAPALAGSLEDFAAINQQPWRAGLSLSAWYRRTYKLDPFPPAGGPYPLLHDPLARRLIPPLPFIRTEKAALASNGQRADALPAGGPSHLHPAGALSTHYYTGLPAEDLAAVRPDPARPNRIFFSSRERDRLICLVVVGGIELESLRLRIALAETSQPQEPVQIPELLPGA